MSTTHFTITQVSNLICKGTMGTCTHTHTHTQLIDTLTHTGVEQDECFEADVLLLLQLQLSKPGGAGQEHVKDLHDPLNTASLFPERWRGKKGKWTKRSREETGIKNIERKRDKWTQSDFIYIMKMIKFI